MHSLLVIALVAIVAGLAGGWIVGRFHSTGGAAISLAAGLVARAAVVVVMADSTFKAAGRGGWFLALAALFVLIGLGAIFTGAITAAALWLALTGRASRLFSREH
jgi:hypothetical protein